MQPRNQRQYFLNVTDRLCRNATGWRIKSNNRIGLVLLNEACQHTRVIHSTQKEDLDAGTMANKMLPFQSGFIHAVITAEEI
ncbi:MAG: hypothetical protein ACR5LF_07345 [Symbiopectobacterium sp.]